MLEEKKNSNNCLRGRTANLDRKRVPTNWMYRNWKRDKSNVSPKGWFAQRMFKVLVNSVRSVCFLSLQDTDLKLCYSASQLHLMKCFLIQRCLVLARTFCSISSLFLIFLCLIVPIIDFSYDHKIWLAQSNFLEAPSVSLENHWV